MAHVCDNPLCRNHIPIPEHLALEPNAVGYRASSGPTMVKRHHHPGPRTGEFVFLCEICDKAVTLVGVV